MSTAPPSTRDRLSGRAAELAAVDALLAGAEEASGVIVDGPRGSGVSSLVRAVASRAQARGMTVVGAAGVEAETGFAYAGLLDILRPLMSVAGSLTASQRAALSDALDTGEADRGPVSVAAAALVASAARRRPVAICVDDVHLLDAETCAVLVALCRRVAHAPCVLIAGTHGGDALMDTGCDRLPLGPLAPADAATVLDAAAPELPAFVRARILHHAQGNPLALVELPAAFRGAADRLLLADTPPLTPRLREAFAPPPAAAEHELLCAALSGAGGGAPELDPLVAAAVVERAAPADLQAAHLACAEAAPERASWHRAAAAPGVDEQVAADLETAAVRAMADGHHVAGAAGLRRAARLTPSGRRRSRRLVAAADALHEVGAWAAGLRLVEDVDPQDLDVAGRAQLVAVRRRVEARGPGERTGDEVVGLARDAAAAGDSSIAMRLLWREAATLQARGGAETAAAAGILAAADDLAGEDEAPVRLSILASLRTREHEVEILDGVRVLVDSVTAPLDLSLLGHAALLTGDGPLALGALDRAEPRLRSAGRLTVLGQALTLTAWAALDCGDLSRARSAGAEAARLTADNGLELWAALGRVATATAAGLAGDEARAEEDAAAAERVALPADASAILALVQHARGLAALSAGRPREAFEHLARVFDPADPCHDRVASPSLVGDLAEAAHADEERAFAARCLAGCPVSVAPRLRVAAAHATLVLAADDDADRVYASARARAGACGPVAEGRMLLVHGMRLRRARRVADSRAPLRRAVALLEGAGALPCAGRAQRELDATAERTHRDIGDQDRLTPQELQIARLVGRGRTNKEIAAELALSPRTVGHHLTSIYRKLGVPSRAGVAGALAQQS